MSSAPGGGLRQWMVDGGLWIGRQAGRSGAHGVHALPGNELGEGGVVGLAVPCRPSVGEGAARTECTPYLRSSWEKDRIWH